MHLLSNIILSQDSCGGFHPRDFLRTTSHKMVFLFEAKLFLPCRWVLKHRLLPLSTKEWEVRVVKFVFDGVLDNVLEDWGPSGHLVGVLVDTILALELPHFLTVPLK